MLETNLSPLSALKGMASETLENFEDMLATLSDETKLQAHLGLKELEQKWHEAEVSVMTQFGKINTAEQKVKTGLDHARVQAHLGMAEAGDALEKSKESLRRVETKVKSLRGLAKGEAVAALDRIALACMDLSTKLEHPDKAKAAIK